MQNNNYLFGNFTGNYSIPQNPYPGIQNPVNQIENHYQNYSISSEYSAGNDSYNSGLNSPSPFTQGNGVGMQGLSHTGLQHIVPKIESSNSMLTGLPVPPFPVLSGANQVGPSPGIQFPLGPPVLRPPSPQVSRPPPGPPLSGPPLSGPPSGPPIPGPPLSGPPSGPPISGPPLSGPPISGPPISGPPSGPPISGPPLSGPPLSGPPSGPPMPPLSGPPSGPPMPPIPPNINMNIGLNPSAFQLNPGPPIQGTNNIGLPSDTKSPLPPGPLGGPVPPLDQFSEMSNVVENNKMDTKPNQIGVPPGPNQIPLPKNPGLSQVPLPPGPNPIGLPPPPGANQIGLPKPPGPNQIGLPPPPGGNQIGLPKPPGPNPIGFPPPPGGNQMGLPKPPEPNPITSPYNPIGLPPQPVPVQMGLPKPQEPNPITSPYNPIGLPTPPLPNQVGLPKPIPNQMPLPQNPVGLPLPPIPNQVNLPKPPGPNQITPAQNPIGLPPNPNQIALVQNPIGLPPNPNQIAFPKPQGPGFMNQPNNPVPVPSPNSFVPPPNPNSFMPPPNPFLDLKNSTALISPAIPARNPVIPSPLNFAPPSVFTPPSNFSSDVSSLSSSISIQRVSISDRNLKKAQEDGRFNQIVQNNPGVQLYSNDAGKGQAYVNIVSSDPRSARLVSDQINSFNGGDDKQWYFLDDKGKFEEYTKEANDVIENGFINGQQGVQIRGQNNMFYNIIYGTGGLAHQQILQNGMIMRTVRRGINPEASTPGNCVLWEWSDEVARRWRPYEPEACGLIENHYNKFVEKFRGQGLIRGGDIKLLAKKEAVLVSGTSGFCYLIDFVNMVQTNEITQRWRGIRREGMNGTFRVSQVKAEPIPWINHPEPGID